MTITLTEEEYNALKKGQEVVRAQYFSELIQFLNAHVKTGSQGEVSVSQLRQAFELARAQFVKPN